MAERTKKTTIYISVFGQTHTGGIKVSKLELQMKKLRKNNQNWLDDFGLDMLKSNTPFICFLSLLGIFYIANTHSAEKKVSKIIALKSENRELNWEYLNLKSELVQNSMLSTLETKLADQEIGLRGQQPVQIIVKSR